MDSLKIAFFGSSEFSIPTLKHLFNDKIFDIKAIITMPPSPKNRGKKILNNVVHDFALQNGFSSDWIFTPKTLKNNDNLLDKLKELDLDFIVVVAYGKIITKDIIDLPKYEILNLHPSALPKYRGAAPIERAIENGEKDTEICIIKVDVGLDTGDIFIREKYSFNDNQFASDIVPDIAEKGAKLMVDSIKKIASKEAVVFEKQTNNGAIYADKIGKNELFIDLEDKTLTAEELYNKIRAFNNSGCCYFICDGLRIKIIKAQLKLVDTQNKTYGFDKTNGEIVVNGGIILPIILQKEGRKAMSLKDFLNGYKK